MTLLKVDKLEVVYHRVITAVQGVTLEVAKGSIVALLGTNGAGKTTTLRAISGFIGMDDARVTQGSITYRGERIENRPPHRITSLGIAIVPERSKVFENLTVDENLEAAVPRRGARFAKDVVYEHFPALVRQRRREAGYLSGGERQMLAIGRILRTGARLLLLDEPTEGLAPVIVQQIGATLRRLKREGFTVLLFEQNFRFAATVADRHYVMEHGRVVDMIPNGAGSGERRRNYRDVKQYRRSRRWYG